MRWAHAVFVSLLVAVPGGVAEAESPPDGPTGILWIAPLEGCQRTPVTGSPGSGRAQFEENFLTGTVTYTVTYQDLTGTVTGVHLHGPAARGADGPTVFDLPMGSPASGTFTPTATLRGQLESGQLYVDVHTTTFPDGELRGQIDHVGSACPPPIDAGVIDAPGPAPDAAPADAGSPDAMMDAARADGCDGCATGGAAPAPWLVAIGALALRRRRRG